MSIPFDGHQFDLVDIVRLLWRRKWLLLLGSVTGALLGIGISLSLSPRYQAEGNLVVRSDALMAPENDKAFESMAVNEAVVTTERNILTSDGLLRRVAEQVHIPAKFLPHESLLQRLCSWLVDSGVVGLDWRAVLNRLVPPVLSSPEAMLENRVQFIRHATTITTDKDSSVITVSTTTPDPELSAAIANASMQTYMRNRQNADSDAVGSIEDALRKRLHQTVDAINQGELTLVRLLHEPGAIENTEIPGQWQDMTRIGVELAKAQVALAELKATYRNGPILAKAQATVDQLQRRMDQERQQRQAQSSVQIAVDSERDRLASLWRVSEALQARLIDLTSHPKNFNAQIISAAIPPLTPAFPSNTLFAISGFLLASILTTLYVVTHAHIHARRPMAIHLANMMHVPLLGAVPQVSTRQRRMLLTGSRSETAYAVALELETAVKENKLHSVMVTSGYSGEGKTTVATILGRTLASMSMRVLLIDLDLRRPHAGTVLSGTSVIDQQQPEDTWNERVDRQSGLHIATPFQDSCDDPLGYLHSSALTRTIERASSLYDLLIFDTPPVMAVPDALVVARLSDAIVLVAELGRTSENETAEISRRLASTRRPLFGMVVTKVTAKDALYTGYGS